MIDLDRYAPAIVAPVSNRGIPSDRRPDRNDAEEEVDEAAPDRPPMAVSIAGVSTACTKSALVSSAKALRKSLSSE